MTFFRRIRTYGGIASAMLGAAVLASGWLMLLGLFGVKLSIWLRRLGHLPMLPRDPMCLDSQYDFTAFWPAGLLARAHDYTRLYNPAAFQTWRLAHLCANAERLDWYYPPPTLAPAMLVSTLPFKPALLVWIAGLSLLAALLLRWARLPWSVILCGLLSPAALYCDELAQLGVLAGALLVAALLLADERPRSAGACLALLLVKPQEALLAPVALLAGRNFRAFAAAALLVALLLAASVLLLGWPAYAAYFRWAPAAGRAVLEYPAGPHSHQNYGVSVFWMLRSFGAGLGTAYAAQLVASVAAVATVWWLWRQPAVEKLDRMALTVFLSLLATPYGYAHDMVAYSLALAALAQRRCWRIGVLDAVLWLWPPLSGVFAADTGLIVTPFIVAVAAGRAWLALAPRRRRWRGSTGIAGLALD